VLPAGCRQLQAGSLRSPEFCGRIVAVLLALGAAVPMRAAAEQPLQPATVVVFNSNDRESSDLAKFYAEKRGIARDHLVPLACSTEEEISRDDYDRTIAGPLRERFKERKWWTVREVADAPPTVTANSIRFVALMKGMPLKIRGADDYPGDKRTGSPIGSRNDASVDSELALLARFSPEISGANTNPYFQSYRPISEIPDAVFMLVCRLDAPSGATVRRMITDAIEAEKNGLWGRAYVDGAHNTSGGLQIGDKWLAEISDQLRKVGVPVVYDDAPEIFADGYPLGDCALYYGWYTNAVAGPFAHPAFRFRPGAVAVHIQSFSASTLRDPGANWAGPLVTKGAAATVGNVYEPFLQLTHNLQILNDRLLHGFTFAESAYMAAPVLSWMSVAIGDPLYRPYGSWLQIETKPAAPGATSEWKMYHDFAVQHSGKPPAEYRTLARQVASRAKNGAMLEDLGLLEARDGNWPLATTYFQEARAVYTKRDDILRAVLHEAYCWAKQGKPKRALDAVRSVLRIISDPATVALFRKVEQDLNQSAAAPPKPRRSDER